MNKIRYISALPVHLKERIVKYEKVIGLAYVIDEKGNINCCDECNKCTFSSNLEGQKAVYFRKQEEE